ncbi:MAG: hypothetical protein DRJ31_03910, partial [Candidatus Methanomethylicota archaeon]
MFRAETMSKVTLFFLKKDLDKTLDFLSKKGVLHIVRVGGEDKEGQALARKAQELYDRISYVVSTLGLEKTSSGSSEAFVIKAKSWSELIKEVEAQFLDIEKAVRSSAEFIKQAEAELKE